MIYQAYISGIIANIGQYVQKNVMTLFYHIIMALEKDILGILRAVPTGNPLYPFCSAKSLISKLHIIIRKGVKPKCPLDKKKWIYIITNLFCLKCEGCLLAGTGNEPSEETISLPCAENLKDGTVEINAQCETLYLDEELLHSIRRKNGKPNNKLQ